MAATSATLTNNTATATSETMLRLIIAYLLTFAYLVLWFGSTWDSQWHSMIGRDRWEIPPHLLMYSSVLLLGLVTLGFVLRETIAYHRGNPQVQAANTVRVLWLFHAPLGNVVTGFGALIMLISAPLDDYWHQLYGIDDIFYSPFHVMAWIGTMVIGTGLVYSFVGLLRPVTNDAAKPPLLAKIGVVLSGAILMYFASVGIIPAAQEAPTWQIGGLQLLNYPLFIALAYPFLFVMLARVVGPGAATIAAVLVWLRPLDPAVVWLMRAVADSNGWAYFPTAPDHAALGEAQPQWMIAYGLICDALVLLGRRLGWSGRRTATLCGLAIAVVGATLDQVWRSDTALYPQLETSGTQLVLITLPLVLILGVISGRLGEGWSIALKQEASK